MSDLNARSEDVSRRSFLDKSTKLVGAAGMAGLAGVGIGAAAETPTRPSTSLISPGNVIIFQGDSITDAGRDKEKGMVVNKEPGLGTGYAWLAAVELLVDQPNADLKIYNRGISGNKVLQLADRWQADCLDLKPDLLSVLIGVNDIWHTLNGNYQGTVEIYERDYNALLERTRKVLPNVKLVICEPFVLRCGAVNDKWFPQFDRYRAVAKQLAQTFGATFIPFQAMFDEAIKYAPPTHWAGDGVHPTSAGASLMAHTWLRCVAGKA